MKVNESVVLWLGLVLMLIAFLLVTTVLMLILKRTLTQSLVMQQQFQLERMEFLQYWNQERMDLLNRLQTRTWDQYVAVSQSGYVSSQMQQSQNFETGIPDEERESWGFDPGVGEVVFELDPNSAA